MFTVYVLLSEKDNKRYIGFTDDIERRLTEHNLGKVKSTKKRQPLRLIYTEEYENKSEAMKREKEIKASKGKFMIPL
ncbi:MAG: GIY-YIG nuclease family protein [Ignavibacteriales bacterium]|nr:MAG: GIY-YIG nuclease family protein [Ignavibacteriales bacterium]